MSLYQISGTICEFLVGDKILVKIAPCQNYVFKYNMQCFLILAKLKITTAKKKSSKPLVNGVAYTTTAIEICPKPLVDGVANLSFDIPSEKDISHKSMMKMLFLQDACFHHIPVNLLFNTNNVEADLLQKINDARKTINWSHLSSVGTYHG